MTIEEEVRALDRLRERMLTGTGEAVQKLWREDAQKMRFLKKVLLMDIRQLRREGALHGRDWHLQSSHNARMGALSQMREGIPAQARWGARWSVLHRLCALNPYMTVMAEAVIKAQRSTWIPEE
jgi:hypothetical protein